MVQEGDIVTAVAEFFDLVERLVTKPHFRDRHAAIAGVDLPRSAVTLLLEVERVGSLTMSELAARVGLDQSTITRQITPLVESGLVRRRPMPSNRRHVIVELSAKGARIRDRLRGAWLADVQHILADWPEAAQQSLAESLRALQTSLRTSALDRALESTANGSR